MTAQKQSSTTMLCIILHAHLPYVRNPQDSLPLEEVWLYQNIAECYIPLIQMCQRLNQKHIIPSIALSISPTLLTMLQQPYYHKRFKMWAHILLHAITLLKKKNTKAWSALDFYTTFITNALSFFENIHGKCADAFGELFLNNSIELLTTAGTHPFFPLYRMYPSFQKLEVIAGINSFTTTFGKSPRGFWLPELGYHAGIDQLLHHNSIEYTIVNDTSVLFARNISQTGNFFPLKTHAGLVLFPRDTVLSMKIWSSREGYPGNTAYREFHYDAMYELPELSPTNEHRLLGLKIYAISGSNHKDYYDIQKASMVVRQQVDDFINAILKRAREVERIIKRKPVFVLPFDAELFGHWWFEGPLFLEMLLETIASRDDIMCVMPHELLDCDMETFEPVESSWGRGNDFSTWYNARVRHIVVKLEELLYRFDKVLYNNHSNVPVLQQCARELMLASSSDWQFMISTGSYADYAQKRFEEHSAAAEKLLDMIEKKITNSTYINARFKQYPVFDNIASLLVRLVQQ
ncbi:MAG: 1,4-alpha-glucan branching protein domain-containing protein [Spirochaetota bacterium]